MLDAAAELAGGRLSDGMLLTVGKYMKKGTGGAHFH